MKDQTAIWRHFQTHEAGVFDRNRPRLDALVAEVERRCGLMRLAGPAAATVVNVGPGNGYLEDRCRSLGFNVVSLDPDPETVQMMKDRGHEAHVAFLDALPLRDESVHCLVASEVLEHVPPAVFSASLAEIRRVLVPGGSFIGTVPDSERLEDNIVFCPCCGERFHRWGHQQSFSVESLRSRIEAVGTVEQVRVQSFIDWSRRSPAGFAKTLIRAVLGRFGLAVASPSIRFSVTR